MNKIFNTILFHTILLFLTEVSGQLTTQLQNDLAGRKMSLNNEELYVKKEITGGGTVDLIDSNTKNLKGICNFDTNKLKITRAFVFDRISLTYATDAASGKEGELDYSTVMPVELQNADFVITQDGREVFAKPVRSLTNINTGQNSSDDYTQLKSLAYLVDDREIQIQLRFPDGVALAGPAKHYIYVRLDGMGTVKKPNV